MLIAHRLPRRAASPRPTSPASARSSTLNRCVRKGEKAIRILAPVTVKQRDEHGEATGEKTVFFRTVPVFDVSMTDPLPGKEPVPLTPPSQPITGDSHQHLIAPLIAHAAALGYTVEIRELPRATARAAGATPSARRSSSPPDPPTGRSARSSTSSRTPTASATQQYGRERCEVLVDCVTYCVLGSVGLDVGGESIPYIAGWGEDGALDAIREYAADDRHDRPTHRRRARPDARHRPRDAIDPEARGGVDAQIGRGCTPR